MLQRISLALAIFIVILVALTLGEKVAGQIWSWISWLTGMAIHNFSDLFALLRQNLLDNGAKVLIALVLTVPITYWVARQRSPSDSQQPARHRRIAIVLAVFLGWLGAHRFYLGQVGWGIGYLLIFYWFLPLAVILGLIDALRYLFMSDQDFAVVRA